MRGVGSEIFQVLLSTYSGRLQTTRALKDARLDPTGKAQSVALGVRIREARMQVDVVLVSPLTRAVETALLMFPSDPAPTVPIVAIELCREAHGGHPCDQRRTISEISKEFPQVNFSQILTDHDAWHRKDRRCARKRGRGREAPRMHSRRRPLQRDCPRGGSALR